MLIVLPIVIPLATAAASLALGRAPRWQRRAGAAGAAALTVAAIALLARVETAGIQAAQMGGWPAPFGITLVADLFSAVMVLLAAVTGLAVAVYSLADIDEPRVKFGYYPLLHVLLMGVCGAFLTGDLFNLYVWFEVMLTASFVLLALGGGKAQMEGAIKYVALNLLSSAVFLAAAGLIYGTANTLNLADLSLRLTEVQRDHPNLVTALALLLVAAFGIKAGLFPLFFWLPASYHTPPPAVSAVFAGLLTKVGVYALIRVFTLVFPPGGAVHTLLLVLAGLTMLTGVLGAVAQFDIRRILSFHIISQIGYMVLGLGLLVCGDQTVRRLALAAAVFYIAHHIIVKANLFLISGVIEALRGTGQLRRLGGLSTAAWWLAALFAIPAFSLAGIPPLSGFWAKFAVIKAGFLAGRYELVAVALAAGLFTLLSMMKIWNEVFWKTPPEPIHDVSTHAANGVEHRPRAPRLVPIVCLAAVTVAIGLWPQPLLRLSDRAAAQLLDPAAYRQAVQLRESLAHAEPPPADREGVP